MSAFVPKAAAHLAPFQGWNLVKTLLNILPFAFALALFAGALLALNSALGGLTGGGHIGTLMEDICPVSHTSIWVESSVSEEPENCARLVKLVERISSASHDMSTTLLMSAALMSIAAIGILIAKLLSTRREIS